MVTGMNMGKVFERAIARFPGRTAIVDPDGDITYTYEEWGERVSEVGSALQETGIGSGDVVCVAMENRVELLTVYWATQQLGAVFAPFNFRSAPDEIAFLLDNVSADILFFSDISREAVVGAGSDLAAMDRPIFIDNDVPDGAMAFESFVNRGTSEFEPTRVDPEETSLILHTSGTTGQPKGVPISHRANYARTVGNPIHLSWEPGDITLGIMPNFHEMGRAAISSTALLNGMYIAQRSWSAEQALRFIQDERITMLYLVPTLYHDLVDYDDFDDYDVSSVEKVGYAGTAMSERVHEEIIEKFSPRVFVNFYGSSEMNCMTTCSWLDEKPGCSGRAGIHTRVRVVTVEGEGEAVSPDATVEPNELGEIILDASSAEAFDGYLNRPESNESSFVGGWYFTGDLGYADEDGDIWVVGRVDDMIISGGENIYPVEVEDVLDGHELIADVAVGGVQHDRLGETVTGFIQPRADVTDDYKEITAAIDEYCKNSDGLADFKRPRKYVFVNEIPKSNVGKKLRRKLRVEDVYDVDVEVHEAVNTE